MMSNIIDGYSVPKFTPTNRYVLIPALNSVFEQNENSLTETEQELSAKDFESVVIAKGDGCSEKLMPGDKIQIFPKGDWFIPVELDGQEFFLITQKVM